LLPNPPPPEPYIFAQANRGGSEDDVDETITNLPELKPESKGQNLQPGEELHQTAENQDYQDSEKDDDSDLEELMRENSELSCSSEDSGQENQLRVTKDTGKNRKRYAYEGPASTIAVLVVASWIIRIPALYRDFLK
jgi:RNA polymerase I-specific transcription initiation factor RRN7